MKINIQKETFSQWKQTYYKLNSPLAELYDEFAYYSDIAQYLWFKQSATPNSNSLAIDIENIPKLIEQGILVDTYQAEEKEMQVKTIGGAFSINVFRDNNDKYSVLIETAHKSFQDYLLFRATKENYLDFANKLKEFADE